MNFQEYSQLLVSGSRPDLELLHQGLDMLDQTASKRAAHAGVKLASFAEASCFAYAWRLAQTWQTSRRAMGQPPASAEFMAHCEAAFEELQQLHSRVLEHEAAEVAETRQDNSHKTEEQDHD